MNIKKEVEDYKKTHSQDSYNKLLIKIFSNLDDILILPSKIRKSNDGFDLKNILDENGGAYLIAYTDEEYIENSDEAFINVSIRGIIDKVLSDDICLGICINPDLEINDSNMTKQCIVPKEHIIKILNS